jgi:hypothetical protein
MSQTTFSETRSLINYMQAVGAPTLNIVKGSNKKDANGVEIPNSASRYVQFMKPNGEQLGRAMLAKKVTEITPATASSLDVSWVEGITESGDAIRGFMIHTRGTVEVIATFSITDMATAQ